MKCKDPLYEALEHCAGTPVLPGIRQKAYFISKRFIVKWPKIVESEELGNDAVTYKDDFVLAADKTFQAIDLLDDKSTVESEASGEYPSVVTLNKASILYPGVGKAAALFAKQANNDDIVYIIQQRSGEFRVLGNDKYRSTTKVNTTLGSDPSNPAGTTLEIEVNDICPAPFYEGIIKTADGDIDAGTGEVVVDPKE